MDKNSEIIRTEIVRVINENGKIRSRDLVNRVIKKVGNEKTVYREISALVESGEIEKKVHSRDHIEYELVNLHDSANRQLRIIHKEIEIVFKEIQNLENISNEEKLVAFQERLRSTIHLIHIVQSVDGIMRILSFYPTFKKDKMFSQIIRRIDDCWKLIMNIIVHQPEEEFLNQVLTNMRISQLNSENQN